MSRAIWRVLEPLADSRMMRARFTILAGSERVLEMRRRALRRDLLRDRDRAFKHMLPRPAQDISDSGNLYESY